MEDIADVELLRVLGGVVTTGDFREVLSTTDPGTWFGFFDGLGQAAGEGDPVGTSVPLPLARVVWTALEAACGAGLEVDQLPDLVIAMQGMGARVVGAEDVVVSMDPMWAQVRAVIPVVAPASVDLVAMALDCAVPDRAAVQVLGDRKSVV